MDNSTTQIGRPLDGEVLGQPPPSVYWLKPQQVAEMLQISIRMVQELIATGQLPASCIGSGKVKRIKYDDFIEYMAEHRIPAPVVAH